ncbi:hypothetical protein KCP77_01205 [Salmonella enterica subsp. enterica]|nr:hypothetical protein KCP77_01205 [Salmonella enterica subsp. enterica]
MTSRRRIASGRSTAGGARAENIQRFLNDFPGADHSFGSRITARPATSLARRTPDLRITNGRLGKNCGLTALMANR